MLSWTCATPPLQRDMAERGHSLESIKASIEARKPDFDAYIDPQKKHADVIIQVRAAPAWRCAFPCQRVGYYLSRRPQPPCVRIRPAAVGPCC